MSPKFWKLKVLTSFITCHIWKLHVVSLQWWQGNIPESVVRVHNLCFAYQTHCFFDILIAITVVVAKAPSWGKACSPWTLKDFQDQRFFLLCTLTGGDQRQDNKKSADKKETRVGDFTFNITAWGHKSFATSHVQSQGMNRSCKLKYC